MRLKRENKELLISLKKNKDDNAEYRIHNSKIETVIGSLSTKTVDQVKELLDLQIIDQNKKLDLIKDKIKKVIIKNVLMHQKQISVVQNIYVTMIINKTIDSKLFFLNYNCFIRFLI